MTPQELSEWQDFTSHPCWGRLCGQIQDMLRKETDTLASQCMQEQEHIVRTQAGVVDGIKRIQAMMSRKVVDARNKPHG